MLLLVYELRYGLENRLEVRRMELEMGIWNLIWEILDLFCNLSRYFWGEVSIGAER